jgi:hypothetical protein
MVDLSLVRVRRNDDEEWMTLERAYELELVTKVEGGYRIPETLQFRIPDTTQQAPRDEQPEDA